MEALRTKLRERHAGMARSTGFGARALRATLTSSFPAREARPTHFDFAQFRRAMASANVNARKEHHRALFEYYCDANGKRRCCATQPTFPLSLRALTKTSSHKCRTVKSTEFLAPQPSCSAEAKT